ncbi:MAG TPA: hypothetical protein VK138_13580 [Acidiferrobacterales bacterium]|nr:hypothetical protein [Acidiferrobacterales bacterium]
MSAISTSKVEIEAIESPSAKVTALLDRLAWLREWEKAQWQEHLHRYTGPQENKNVQQPTELEPLNPEIGYDQKLAPPAPSSSIKSGHSTLLTGHTSYRFALVNGRMMTQAPRLLANNFVGVSWSMSPSEYRACIAEPDVKAAMSPVNWLSPEFTQWQPQFLRVINSAKGMRVWIRDFRIATNRGGEILTALRRELASLGMELASLVVNGNMVWDKADQQEQGVTDIEDQQLHINYVY